MQCHQLVDNQVEVREYISSCGIQQDRKGTAFYMISDMCITVYTCNESCGI